MTFKEQARKGFAMYLLSEEGFEIFNSILWYGRRKQTGYGGFYPRLTPQAGWVAERI
jgi:hypothetical protein